MIVEGVAMASVLDAGRCDAALSVDSVYGPDKGGRDLGYALLGRR
jgi:hypothetical protein